MRAIILSSLLLLLLISVAGANDDISVSQAVTSEFNEAKTESFASAEVSYVNDVSEKEDTQTSDTKIVPTSSSAKSDDSDVLSSSLSDEVIEQDKGQVENDQGLIPPPSGVWCDALLGVYRAYFYYNYTEKLDHDQDKAVTPIDLALFVRRYSHRDTSEAQDWCYEQLMRD